MTEEQINRFRDEYENYTDFNLDEELSHFPQLRMTSKAFINRSLLLIKEEIHSRAARFEPDEWTDEQRAAVKKATFEQMTYMLASGDFSLLTGYDPETNTILDLKELRKRQFSPLAIRILENAGLLYGGMNRRLPYMGGRVKAQNFDLSDPDEVF